MPDAARTRAARLRDQSSNWRIVASVTEISLSGSLGTP
ncbi:hypothetical protein BURPS1710b_A0721 [Burkholderia pseudomallei 1710b]|uniref:Uncharacterized protein n=1 Tax=Burkholderia pseudomallei (strain 1710b) TaxID=320372 RepID=Q3JKM3_BURP1|nr:hypothetical protein BURPS1710b_A0721 [Burkholderia pseudomallei 1710b]